MATFIGFNTQKIDQVRSTRLVSSADGGTGSTTNSVKTTRKFRTVDNQLVIQDLINALNIPQGQKPGRPEYGTTLWSFVFEPNTLDAQIQIENEIRRVAGQDPRLALNSVASYPQDNGILVEVEFSITPFNNVEQMSIMFDQNTTTAYGT